MIKEEGEKRNFLSDYFSVKPVCPCPTAGGPARGRRVGFLLKLLWIFGI